jgi:hypothetical protein
VQKLLRMLFQREIDATTSLISPCNYVNTKATYIIPVVAREKKGPPNPNIERVDMWSLLHNR